MGAEAVRARCAASSHVDQARRDATGSQPWGRTRGCGRAPARVPNPRTRRVGRPGRGAIGKACRDLDRFEGGRGRGSFPVMRVEEPTAIGRPGGGRRPPCRGSRIRWRARSTMPTSFPIPDRRQWRRRAASESTGPTATSELRPAPFGTEMRRRSSLPSGRLMARCVPSRGRAAGAGTRATCRRARRSGLAVASGPVTAVSPDPSGPTV